MTELEDKIITALHVQEVYQKIGMNQKDDDHTPKVRWHARGGYDLIQWLKEEIPELGERLNQQNIRKLRPC